MIYFRSSTRCMIGLIERMVKHAVDNKQSIRNLGLGSAYFR